MKIKFPGSIPLIKSLISVPFHLNIFIKHQQYVKKPLDYCFHKDLLGTESTVLDNLPMRVPTLSVTYMLSIQYDYVNHKRISRI